MFKLSPEVYTVKDVASALKLTPRAIQKSIERTGQVRGIRVDRASRGIILFTGSEYRKITRS